MGIPGSIREEVAALRGKAEAEGRDLDLEIIAARYRFLDAITAEAVTRATTTRASGS